MLSDARFIPRRRRAVCLRGKDGRMVVQKNSSNNNNNNNNNNKLFACRLLASLTATS